MIKATVVCSGVTAQGHVVYRPNGTVVVRIPDSGEVYRHLRSATSREPVRIEVNGHTVRCYKATWYETGMLIMVCS